MNLSSLPVNTITNEIKITGCIQDEQKEILISRLTSIIGSKPKPFKEWINVYRTKSSLPPVVSTNSNISTSEDASMISLSKSKEVEFHILADIVVEKLNQTKSIEQVIWREIKSLGKIVIPKKEAPFKSTVRTVTLSTIYGGNPLVMSEMMGCE